MAKLYFVISLFSLIAELHGQSGKKQGRKGKTRGDREGE